MSKDETFALAQAFVEAHEGGYSDDPRDGGGATNHGVSAAFLKDLQVSDPDAFEAVFGAGSAKSAVIDAAFIRSLAAEQAAALFKREFWDKPRVRDLPPALAAATYDFAVNAGAKPAVRVAQKAISKLSGFNLKADGLIGPATLTAALGLEDDGGAKAAKLALEYRADWYRNLAAGNARHKWALKGWLNRTRDAEELAESAAEAARGAETSANA